MTQELMLSGLDGSNPIGYLAALGVFRALHDLGEDVRLRWEHGDAWRPFLSSVSKDELLELLERDLVEWKKDADELTLRYPKETKKGISDVAELKPPPELFQEFAKRAADACGSKGRRWADYVACFAAAHENLGTDNNHATKPTALHFTAGNQMFIQMVCGILECVGVDELDEALFGPWKYEGVAPVLNWDIVAGERNYALRATNPSGDKKKGVPGADWLAFRGMSAFPVVLRQKKAATTAFEGSGKNYQFHWALWSGALDFYTMQSVVGTRWDCKASAERKARGIAHVLSSQVRRTDQGGYGSFLAPTTM